MKYFLIFVSLFYSIAAISQDKWTVDTIQVKSVLLNETRKLIVIKQHPFSTNDSVNLLYMTDGESAVYRYRELVRKSGDSISGLVLVGIENTDRRRDLLYVKGASTFLNFLTTELIPEIEKDYICKKRMLFGHSFGGSFTIYAMLNKPEYFDTYIASSPTPIMNLVEKESYLKIDGVFKRPVDFYLSYGSNDMKQVIKWADILKNNLTGNIFTNLNWHFNVFEGKDHNTSDIPALVVGLQ